MPSAFGVSGKGESLPGFVEPSSYAGAVIWPFAVLGLFSRRREKWPLALLAFLGIAMAVRLVGIADAVSALPIFDIGLNDRMVFLGSFGVAALTALGLERAREGSGSGILLGVAFSGTVLLAAIYVSRRQRNWSALNMPPEYFRYRFFLELLPLLATAGLWILLSRRGAASLAAGLVLLLLIAQRGLEQGGYYPTYPSASFYPPLRALDAIPKKAPERMAAVGFTFIPNIAALYEVEDVRGYEAMTFKPLFDTFPLWCVHQPVWFNRVDNLTRPFLSFLNVRYVLAPPDHRPPEGWKVLYRGEEGQLFENPRALARAFVPRMLWYEANGERQVALLYGSRDFSKEGVVGGSPRAGASVREATPNGEASVRIVAYEPQRMELEVEAARPALVATSMTAWPGWKLTVDDAPVPLVSYNHAFLAFRVTPGRHVAVLRYWPGSFVAGAAISAATLAMTLLAVTVPRWRGGPAPTRMPAET